MTTVAAIQRKAQYVQTIFRLGRADKTTREWSLNLYAE